MGSNILPVDLKLNIFKTQLSRVQDTMLHILTLFLLSFCLSTAEAKGFFLYFCFGEGCTGWDTTLSWLSVAFTLFCLVSAFASCCKEEESEEEEPRDCERGSVEEGEFDVIEKKQKSKKKDESYVIEMSGKEECKPRVAGEKEKDALEKPCKNCGAKIYKYECCSEELGLCIICNRIKQKSIKSFQIQNV